MSAVKVRFLAEPDKTDLASCVGARLDAVRRHADLSQSAFCDLFGISRSSYLNYIGDKRDLPLSLARQVIERFDLDAEWFVFGGEGRNKTSKKGADR